VEWGGPGSRLPDRIESMGEIRLELQPFAFAVYGGEPAATE
jgi:hypothetical protein